MTVSSRLVLVCDVAVSSGFEGPGGGWLSGPHVETYTDHKGRTVRTDGAARASNFPASLAGRLFGNHGDTPNRTRFATGPLGVRWDTGDVDLPASTTLHHAELLIAAPGAHDGARNRAGVLALHFEVVAADFADAVHVANNLARQRGGSGESQLHGALTYSQLRRLHPGLCSGIVLPTDAEAGTETEPTIYSRMMLDQMRGEGADPQALDVRQAYSAASGQDIKELHASADALDRASASALRLSRSWSALFLRHGASFLVHTEVDDPYREYMPIYFGSLYADALMLVRLQVLMVRQMESAAESLLEQAAANPHLGAVSDGFEALDRQLAVNSARYWMRRSESNAGNSVKVIHGIQDAMSFTTRLGALDAQIDGLARLSDADAQKSHLAAQNRLAAVVTLMGSIAIPVTIAIDAFQLLGLPVTAVTLAGLVVTIALFAGITWKGLTRLMPRS